MTTGLKGKDFLTMIQNGTKPVIRVHEPFEEFETILDQNMRGRVINAQERDGMVKLFINLNEFETENDSLMKCNYYDENGDPCLNAKQAKMYPVTGIEEVYLDHNDILDEYLTIEPEKPMMVDCKICGCRDEGAQDNWTDGYECRGCGQEYRFDEGLMIVLSEEQYDVLREYQKDSRED